MKTSSFILLLSLLANLSFANLSGKAATYSSCIERLDTVGRDGLSVNLLGDWNNIEGSQGALGFASLSIYASGKFEGINVEGKKVCGDWELTKDNISLVLHKVCDKTGKKLETVIAKIEVVDGHMLTMHLPSEQGGKQLFIQ